MVEIAFLFIAIVYSWSLMKEAHLAFSCVRDVKLKHSALITQTWVVTLQAESKVTLLIKAKCFVGKFFINNWNPNNCNSTY